MKHLFLMFFMITSLFSNSYESKRINLDKELNKFLNNENKNIDSYLNSNKDNLNYFIMASKKYKKIFSKNPESLNKDFDYKIINYKTYGKIIRVNHKTYNIEEVLDINTLVKDSKYYDLDFFAISNNHKYLAFTDDKKGDGKYSLNILNIKTKNIIETKLNNLESTIVWDYKGENIYVLAKDDTKYRTNALYKYNIENKKKTLVYKENNSSLVMSLYKTSNDAYAILSFNDYDSSIQKIIDLKKESKLLTIKELKKGFEYYSDIINDKVIIYSNKDKDFSLYKTKLNNLSSKEWINIYSNVNSDEKIEKWNVFENFIALQINKGSKVNLKVIDFNGKILVNENLSKSLNTAWLSRNNYAYTNKIRIRTQALNKTPSWLEYNVKDKKFRTLSKEKYSNYKEDNYISKEIFVNNNNTLIPVSLVYNKNKITNTSPIYLYVYGAYNVHMKKYFMKNIIPLLDKGFIYAIAHVRGGSYLGDSWAKDGIGKNRLNSINDFISVARYLKTYKSTEKRNIIVQGSSAGTVIVSAAINKEPLLFKAAILKVPFLEIIKSLKDNSTAYKTIEYAQWGNPNIKNELDILKQYDPINNIKHLVYPTIMTKVSIYDSKVNFMDGVNYTKKLRKNSISDNNSFLYTNFNAGHKGGIRNSLYENILDYTFILTEGLK
ncbi:MAG: prolyl oligopeptidase family serine peptidase [Campylobacterales bacterium]|nr:prolyl oligopeptidase family serine peptidase [Campylobacterales bacterium]